MKKSKLISLLLVSSILVSLCPLQAFAMSSVSTVTIQPSSTLTFDVELANDQIHSDENASTLVPNNVLAAVNGGFFNSYYNSSSTITFPDNSPRIYGAIVKDGQVINGTGDGNMFGFTYDGDILIDRVNVQPYFVVNESLKVNAWAVNQIYTDATAIMIITDDFDMSFNVSANDVVFTVKDGVITEQSSATTQTVADGTYKIIYKSTSYQNSVTWNNSLKVGDNIQFSHSLTAKSGDSRWDNVKTAITGGRMLVIDGVDVSAREDYNSSFDTDEKQTNYSSQQRTFISTYADGTILFQTTTGTFADIAQYLVGQGAVYAISVDGGASSMMYSSSSGFVVSAGRELASILVAKTDDGTDIKPDDVVINESSSGSSSSSSSSGGSNEPSSWAVDSINTATQLGIIPTWMLYGYTSDITRGEFCNILVTFIAAKTGKTVDQYRSELGVNYDDYTFTDTDSYQIRSIAALGIVNGTGDGKFSTDDSLTREQAATMIKRLADLIGTTNKTSYSAFDDQDKISDWAVEAVDFIASSKIMNGTGTGFEPEGTYTKEQAFITMLNLYNALIVS